MINPRPSDETPRPTEYRPAVAGDFFGGRTRRIAEIVLKKAESDWTTAKMLFTGPPGTGKSRLAEVAGLKMAGSPFTLDRVNGQSLTIEVVRGWRQAAQYRPLLGRTVKLVEEVDAASPAAQNELRTYLDELKDGAFIATSNKKLDELQDQLTTRCTHYRFDGVGPSDVTALLLRWLPPEVARGIAVGCCGCVRAALIDAESWLDSR